MDSRRSAAGSTRKAVELPVETDIENLMGPGADSAPGALFRSKEATTVFRLLFAF